ncbi:MAG: hypothetical protein V1789_00920 [PVC group bacterium]
MIEPTVVTWIIVVSGLVSIFLPILYGQLLMVRHPRSQKTRNLMIGKGEDWRDRTHLRFSLGAAWADLILWLPLILAGSIGVLLGRTWGYALWTAGGAISVYINIILWFSEREYVFPANGPLKYYTYYWGFFVYWGIATVLYSIVRLIGVRI